MEEKFHSVIAQLQSEQEHFLQQKECRKVQFLSIAASGTISKEIPNLPAMSALSAFEYPEFFEMDHSDSNRADETMKDEFVIDAPMIDSFELNDKPASNTTNAPDIDVEAKDTILSQRKFADSTSQSQKSK